MTVITDNVRLGLNDGLAHGPGSAQPMGAILNGVGDPTDVVTAQTGSQLFVDGANQEVYMASLTGGSSWYRLGSLT